MGLEVAERMYLIRFSAGDLTAGTFDVQKVDS